MSSLLILFKTFSKKKLASPWLYYVKSNTSRFGSAIQVFASDIGEYCKLSFTTFVVVVFISIFQFFSFLYSEITCVIYTAFVAQKCHLSM